MRLHGIHHITAITADAQTNLDFYSRLLGLRFVKKTVNFDDPTAYHLYYGDERGTPGSILTFFEYPGVPIGSAGDGMIHRITWHVSGEPALDFWERRLVAAGLAAERHDGRLRFNDPEGLELELATGGGDAPLAAAADDIPRELALQGFAGVRAYAAHPERSTSQLREQLGFEYATDAAGHQDEAAGDGVARAWRIDGPGRSASYVYDPAPSATPVQGAGTVHHIAWAVPDDEQAGWRRRIIEGGLHATPIIDRTYFRSVYFREPSGVLFEIATLGPGFTVDEPLESLGRDLKLPARYETLRPRLEQLLTPLRDPRRRVAA